VGEIALLQHSAQLFPWRRVPPAVAAAVAKSGMETGVARIQRDPDAIARDTRAFLYEGELGSL
jgi:hypothetical protein